MLYKDKKYANFRCYINKHLANCCFAFKPCYSFSDYKEIPVDIETFLTNDNYLGLAYKRGNK